jgi:hypothetical protein
MGLAGATGPAGDEPEALGDELGAEEAVEQGEPDTGLEGEIELLDGLEDREAAAAHAPSDPNLGAMRGLLSDQQG